LKISPLFSNPVTVWLIDVVVPLAVCILPTEPTLRNDIAFKPKALL